ncbi:aminoglycoside phosphotransferase [Streptomyces camponoticapitis]|uniref:Aminoglycoside phosphotransferase n=1 Tax=Streptomyces camponoticapitis TaxID=1616125 RepID=A0ABQ2EDQ9_9ACTN|nr:aminoglycoside phosphotransferase family protein [Streptomyces camponoticapitis]GGK04738.1 aminoglycoside phosphotransferase [Streptomyces camponoticapitis]
MSNAGHQDTVPEIGVDLVRGLLAAQFPRWGGLTVTRLADGGSDHVIFLLGDDMSVRLPRGDWAAGQAEKEHAWLPWFAPQLPLAIPVPLGLGVPGLGYPYHWSVTRWLDGSVATADGFADPEGAARQLGGFLKALQQVPTVGDGHGLSRWSLIARDDATRTAIKARTGAAAADAMTRVWDAALAAPGWDAAPVWYHGDFHTGNLLTADGHVSAVIDFGGLGVGDPACDLMVAWTTLSAATRPVFRAALGVDDATWARGRGWALATGLNAYTHYAATDPRVAAQTRRQIDEAISDEWAEAEAETGAWR